MRYDCRVCPFPSVSAQFGSWTAERFRVKASAVCSGATPDLQGERGFTMRIHYQTRRHGVRPWTWKVEVLAWMLWKDDSSRFIDLGLALCAECLLDGTNWLCTLQALTAARNVTYRYRISDEDAKK